MTDFLHFDNASSLTSIGFAYDTEHRLWVLKTHLLDAVGISENTVREGLRDFKAKAKSWKYVMLSYGETWIQYDTIPIGTRAKITNYYATTCADVHAAATDLILRGRFEAAREPGDCEWFLGQSVKRGGRSYSADEARDLGLACGILRQLDRDIDARIWKKGFRVDRQTVVTDGQGYIGAVAKIVKKWQLFGFKIGTMRGLYKAIADWKTHDRQSLVSERFGKANAEKKTAELLRTAIVLKGSATKLTDRDIAQEIERRYNMKLTPQTVGNWLNDPSVMNQFLAVREGKVLAQKRKTIWIAQGKCRFADEMWYVDTTTVQMFVADDAGKKTKIPMNRVTVLDAYSDKRVGVAYGVTETAELVWQAMYFAFKTTGRLPQVLRSDNGGANTRADLVAKYGLLGITHITNKPRRSTANRQIEYDQHRHERLLQRVCENFSGGNFMGRGQQMRFNPDRLKQLEREGKLPTWLEAIATDYTLYMAGNDLFGKDGKTPNERYGASFHAERRDCSLPLLVNVFAPRDGNYLYQNGQILFRHKGVDLTFWVGSPMAIDEDFYRRHDGNRFKIRWNPDDTSVIGLYSDNWEFVAVAHQKHKFTPNPKALTEDERTALNHNLGIEKRLNTEGSKGFAELKQAMTTNNELTWIDYDIKTKTALHEDTLAAMYEQIEQLGILDKNRARVGNRSQPSVIEVNSDKHFFEDDAFALTMLD